MYLDLLAKRRESINLGVDAAHRAASDMAQLDRDVEGVLGGRVRHRELTLVVHALAARPIVRPERDAQLRKRPRVLWKEDVTEVAQQGAEGLLYRREDDVVVPRRVCDDRVDLYVYVDARVTHLICNSRRDEVTRTHAVDPRVLEAEYRLTYVLTVRGGHPRDARRACVHSS